MRTQIHALPEQKENAKHGEYLFPIQKYTTNLRDDYPTVQPHWHDEAEFTLITKGSCTCQIELENYEVHEGDLIFIPSTLLHSLSRQTKIMESDTYVFHMNFLGAASNDICSIRYLSPMINQELIPPFIIRHDHPAHVQISGLFQQMNIAWDKKVPGYEMLIKSHLIALMAFLLPYCSEGSKVSPIHSEHSQKMRTALEYISAHFTEDLSIADIAAACYFSEYHFMRFFKKHMGVSCMEYIKNLKLEHAAKLFETSNQSILDVSLASGFHNLSYFYREFKKKYGMTPREWMKNN